MTRFARRQSALAVALSSALAVDGCATPHTIIDDVGARSVPTNLAFVTLGPGAPGPLSIVETRYANATRQSIALVTHGQTQGENQMRADVFGLTNEGVAPGSTLADRPLNEVALFSEAEEALPNVPLRISLNYMQNRFGPFGYAVGRTMQGETCIYAWQRLATPDQNVSLVNSRVTLSVRLRLCDPRASEAQLAAAMMNLSVNRNLSGASLTPEPRNAAADIGVAGVPMAPAAIMASATDPLPQSSTFSRPTPPRQRLARPRRQPAPRAAASAIQPPDASSSVVPPPPPVSSSTVQPVAGAGPAAPSPTADVPPPPKETRP